MTATGAEAGSDLAPDPESTATPVRALLLRAIVAVVVALLAAVAAWLLLQHGVRTDAYPAFLPGTDSTGITRYSGPWLTAAAGAALVAALALLSAGLDLRRWRRSPAG